MTRIPEIRIGTSSRFTAALKRCFSLGEALALRLHLSTATATVGIELLISSDDGEDDPDSDQRDDLDHRYLEDDDAEEWESEEKYGRASRHRFADYSNIREWV